MAERRTTQRKLPPAWKFVNVSYFLKKSKIKNFKKPKTSKKAVKNSKNKF
jgi:hypothetical protein